jgi:hypothetical protein
MNHLSTVLFDQAAIFSMNQLSDVIRSMNHLSIVNGQAAICSTV